MSYKDEWLMIEANDDIDEDFHREPTEEFRFYRAVANGDVETVRRNCEQSRFEDQEGVGVLSRDPVTNMKYHFVVTTAMITRMCRQYGMELEQAFRLSDFYIRQLDDIHTEAEVCRLHDEMVMDYTEKMRKYRHSNANSKHINACKEYIYSHIKERITIEELADVLGVSASYLSRLFKKETGVSVSTYIRDRKIDMAKNLLRFSDASMIDIANRLAFSSQSHFIQQFKESVGMTPKKYRDKYYMVEWNIEPAPDAPAPGAATPPAGAPKT
ncbi:helix-turn-helix transcriptional regulator [uncultured Subdoligranulum sp.]|uniref:helix-turn-helix transcriptional regulator n=1 Tax=uncultured Subdoligranulum sp. TaxID=512298 RepID=UPI002602B99A|nr:helix-turn-helix transcriptional regulator [uncultured Subdoligranulum sp.]